MKFFIYTTDANSYNWTKISSTTILNKELQKKNQIIFIEDERGVWEEYENSKRSFRYSPGKLSDNKR